MEIILLEDDPVLSKEIKEYFRSRNVACDTVFDGDLFFRAINNKQYDIYVLDINVPKINGLDVCRRIRETDNLTPVLMLTALGEITDKVDAFQLGADDYLVKPCHLEELYLRTVSLYRRKEKPQQNQNILEIADLKIDLNEQLVFRSNQAINLTPKEYKLLVFLARSKGRVLSKQVIADELWEDNIEINLNTIEVYINFLRNKIDKNSSIRLIHTKIGYGYYLKEE
jgi:DNA-binding response OmpR family regulator